MLSRPGFRTPLLLLVSLSVGACLQLACNARSEQPGRGTAPATEPAVAPPDASGRPARPKIVMLGDSLTAGLGLLETQSYPGLLQERVDAEGYGFEVVNAGVSGDTSAGGLRRLDWALEGDVRILILALGANDGLRGLSVAQMKKNLSEIITRAKARNVVVILAGMEAPPNYGPEYAQSFRQAFRQLALTHRVTFLPFLLDKVGGQSALNQDDGIHPNAEGAVIVADTVWAVLKPMLDQMAANS
jgi:acyl-CoA thioesterase-1